MRTFISILKTSFLISILVPILIFAQNYSLHFDGITGSSYVRTSQVDTASNNFTMEFWAKPLREINWHPEGEINPPNNPPFLNFAIHASHGDDNWGAGHTGVGIEVGTNGVNVFEHAASYTSSSLVWLSPGSITGWNHIAVVYENKQPRLYINGQLVRTGVTSTKDFVHPSLGYCSYYTEAGIGNQNSDANFLGYLDEIRFSNIVRYNSSFIPQTQYENDQNTIGLFHFDEGAGNTAYDESSLNNNGTLYGPTWSTDIPGQSYSLQFDGVNDYIEIPNSSVFDLTSNFTIETYVKINTQEFIHNSIISKAPNSGWTSGWELAYGQYNANMLSFFGSPGNNNLTASYQNPEFDKWYHIAGVYDGTTWKIFVDGVLDSLSAIVNASGEVNINSLPIVLGRRAALGGNTHFLKGLISSARVSNIARYNSPFIPPTEFQNDPNTIGLWNMNEGQGNIIYDASGNGNNGLINGPTWSPDVPGGSTSSLLLQTPNGGENWIVGEQHNIMWSSSNIDNIEIEYSTDAGTTWIEIINSIPASNGSYLWTLPNTPSEQCKVKISDVLDSTVYDISNSTFQINSYDPIAFYPFNGNADDESGNGYHGTVQGAILTSNRFGESNKAYKFDGINDLINVFHADPLMLTGSEFTLSAWVTHDSVDSWDKNILVKSDGIGNTNKWAFIYHINNPFGVAYMCNPGGWVAFENNPTVDTWYHYLIVKNQNSLKIFIDGNLVSSTVWPYNNPVTNADLRIGGQEINGGGQWWFGKIDDIRIYNRAISESEAIALYNEGGWPISNVTVESPNGGENLIVGDQYDITWTSNNISNVKIEYSTNSGVSWISVVNSTPSDGSYNWTIPANPSNNCKVKITNIDNPSIFDESNSVFSIIQPSITVNSPNGGEGWQIGTTQNITWASTNVNNVKIEYTTNNGSSWNLITASTTSDGTFEWTIPNSPSTQCKIKITDISNPNISDQSDNTFSIVEFIFYALIQADSIWIDSDYDGLELGMVDGSGSFISQGSIVNYEWYVNNEFVTNGISPTIELITGTNIVRLVIFNDTGLSTSDSIYISVYSAKLSTGGPILSGVSQYDQNFYVTSMNNGVYRIDSTGTILQSYLTGGSIQSSLCISNETGLMYVGSNDTRLYCFDSDLNSFWDAGLGGVVNNSASVNYLGDIVYTGANDNNTDLGFLKSLNASTGSPNWTFQTDGTILSSPIVLELVDSNNVVVRTIVYFGTSKGSLYALDDLGSSYDLFWSATVSPDSAFVSSPAFSDDGMLFIGSKNGYLYRFFWDGSYQSGWKKFTGGQIISSPIIDDNGIVYIASASGFVYGFNKEFTFNSDPVKTFYQNTGINGTPGIGPDGSLLVGCDNGKFFSINKDFPTVEMPVNWFFDSSGPIYAPTLVTENGIVYIGSTNGDLFVLRDPNVGTNNVTTANNEWPTFKGNNQRSKVIRLITQTTSIDANESAITSYDLSQNFPNPYNPSTTIKYQIPEAGFVSLKVYDVLGNLIATLVSESKTEGRYQVTFDASSLTSGVYIYQIRSNDFVDTKKMLLIK